MRYVLVAGALALLFFTALTAEKPAISSRPPVLLIRHNEERPALKLSRPRVLKASLPRPKAKRVDQMRMLVTAYCPCRICCEKSPHDKNYGITASGTDAFFPDGVATDNSLLPPGTLLSIPGIGMRVVDDTGGAMREAAKQGYYHIDVRMRHHSDAARFGHHWLTVTVIR